MENTSTQSPTRKRSFDSRSRSRSPGFGNQRRRYSTNRRYESSFMRKRNYPKDARYRRSSSSNSPTFRRRTDNGKFSFMDSKSRFCRLRNPEIQGNVRSVAEFQTDGVRASRNKNENVTMSLNERFTRLTNSGTALFNRTTYGRLTESNRLPHLILTNNSKLPPATLARQAKEISIVIERTFPLNAKSSTRDTASDRFFIPCRPNEGHKPVFDRSEIVFYNTTAEEASILDTLSDQIASAFRSRRFTQRGTSKPDVHDLTEFVGPGRFYGSRVDERLVDSNNASPLDPAEIPRGQSYYLHDDRSADHARPKRRWNNFPTGRGGSQHNNSNQSSHRFEGSPQSPRRMRPSNRNFTDNCWLHDKFEEMEGNSSKSQRPIPKPVPAPKPILWSTIGKESCNGNTAKESSHQNYSPNSAINQSPLTPSNEHYSSPKSVGLIKEPLVNSSFDHDDLRIDAEPVIDESLEHCA